MSKDNKKLENIELRSEEVQEILTRVPHWMIRWGNLLFLALIILLLFLSWFIKYPDSIMSEAIVTTQIPPQREYAKSTGKLEVILVKDNEMVSPNQPLAVIENTANYTDVFTLKSMIDTMAINSTSFNFPLYNIPLLFLGDIETQYALFENSYVQYRLNKEFQPFSNEASANRYTISQLQERLHNMQVQREINKTELLLKQKDLERNKTLFEKGIISAQDYENKQLESALAERNYKNFETSLSQIRENLGNAQKNSKSTQIDKVKQEMVLLKNVIQAFNQLKKAIKDWENNYVLMSDISGRVSFLNYWSTNQTVSQGDLIFTIIPNKNSAFVVKLTTPAQNSGKIKIDQVVNISLENYPENEFGILKGKIAKMSLVANNEGFYLIDVTLPQKLVTTYNKEIPFKQEMRGSAEIVTEDLRLIERFFYQLRQIINK